MKWLDTLKWIATGFLIVGFGMFSAGIDVGWYVQISGGILWLAAALYMRDKPLIATNSFMTAAGIIGKLLS